MKGFSGCDIKGPLFFHVPETGRPSLREPVARSTYEPGQYTMQALAWIERLNAVEWTK